MALTSWGTSGAGGWAAGMNFIAGVSGVSALSNWLAEKRRSSPTYKTPEEYLGLVQDKPLPIVYGKNRVAGHVIYREDTYDKEYDYAIGLCEGEVSAIDNIKIEGRAIEDIGESAHTIYKGTSTQTGDDIFKKGVIVMPCVADAFIDDANKDTTYNTGYLMVRESAPERRIYLKFSLTDIPPSLTITSAEIRLRKSFVTATHDIKGHAIATENWAESTLTWNNAPAPGTQYLSDSDIKPGGDYGSIFFNAAGIKALKAAYIAGQTTFSMDIQACEGLDFQFKSKDSEFVSPQLVITFAGATPAGFRNTAYIAMNIDNGAEQLSNEFSRVTAEVEGLKISAYDGESWGAAAYSNNPAWIVYDFLTNTRYGLGISSSLIDADSIKTVADYCDETVTLANGQTEKRYMCDLVIDTLGEAIDPLEEILATFSGYLQYYDGLIYLGVEKNRDTDHTFSTSNINHGTFGYQQVEKNDIPNIVRIAYTEPAEDYGQVYVQAESEIDRSDNGDRIAELRMFGINRASQARRRANWILWKGLLAEYACQFRISIKHCHVTAGDVCEVTHAVPGWSSKKFRIIEVFEYSDDELQLTCTEYIEVTTALEEDLPETSYYTRTGGENTLLASAVPAAPTWTLVRTVGGWQVIVTSYVAGTLKYELCKYMNKKWKCYATFAENRNSAGDGALVYKAHASDPSVETYGKFKLRVITAADQSELSDEQADFSKPDPSLVDSANFVPTLPDEDGTYPTLTAKEVSGGDYKFKVVLKVVLPSGYEDHIQRVEMQRRDNDGGWNDWLDLPHHPITTDPAPSVVMWTNTDALLTPGVTYQWRARCVATDGTESAWTTALEKVIADDTTPPAKPTVTVIALPLGNLLTIVGGTEADFAYFKIEGSDDGGSGWSTLVEKQVLTIWMHDITVAGIATSWRYRVTAYDRTGNASTVSTATTDYTATKIVADVVAAATLLASNMAFTVAGTTNIVGVINASSEGITISSARTAITSTVGVNTAAITVNATNINLRVQKNDVINQINISSEGIRIAGDNLAVDANTTFSADVSIRGLLNASGGIKTSTGNDRIEIGNAGESIKLYYGGNAELSLYSGLAWFKAGGITQRVLVSIDGISMLASAYLDVEERIQTSAHYKVGENQVVGAQGAAVADAAEDLGEVKTQLNLLLARVRAHGLIST